MIASAERAHNPGSEIGSAHNQRHRDGNEDRQRHGQHDRQEPGLPPWPPVLDVVGAIERRDDHGHRRGAAPDRTGDAQGQQAAAPSGEHPIDLLTDEDDHILGQHGAQAVDCAVERGIDGEVWLAATRGTGGPETA
jgi:hypothetical protein